MQLGNGVNLMDPSFQQKLEGEKELLRRAIQKELKIKEGAENLRKATTDRKNLAHIEHVLKSSNRKLEQLHWELQELNARIVITDKEDSKTGMAWVTDDRKILRCSNASGDFTCWYSADEIICALKGWEWRQLR